MTGKPESVLPSETTTPPRSEAPLCSAEEQQTADAKSAAARKCDWCQLQMEEVAPGDWVCPSCGPERRLLTSLPPTTLLPIGEEVMGTAEPPSPTTSSPSRVVARPPADARTREVRRVALLWLFYCRPARIAGFSKLMDVVGDCMRSPRGQDWRKFFGVADGWGIDHDGLRAALEALVSEGMVSRWFRRGKAVYKLSATGTWYCEHELANQGEPVQWRRPLTKTDIASRLGAWQVAAFQARGARLAEEDDPEG